jgi:hypothetical protein
MFSVEYQELWVRSALELDFLRFVRRNTLVLTGGISSPA